MTGGERRIEAGVVRKLAEDGWEVVAARATGRYDGLGRYPHAEHNDVDELLVRIHEACERDLDRSVSRGNSRPLGARAVFSAARDGSDWPALSHITANRPG